MDIEAVNAQIAATRRGRKWLLVTEAAAAGAKMVERLKEQDADGIMLVAGLEGVGDVPEVDRIHYTRASGDTIMQGVRAFARSVEDPSDELLRAVDAFDPENHALVLNAAFSGPTKFFGRRTYGSRDPRWRTLEDKMIVDELWDAAAVTRAPSEIVAVNQAAAVAAHLSGHLGTVWVGDNKEGWHGGGEYVRWVRDRHDTDSAAKWFNQHADAVRVMPFLDGVPCSIHGFITTNGIAVMRPVELNIFRHTDGASFYYAGGSNFWNPPDGVMEEMRSACRRVGSVLSDRHGYVGAYGIDGICTKEGFRPTELNPRISLGHDVHALAAEVPLDDMERSMLAGDLNIDATDLEATLLDLTDQKRRGGAMFELESQHEPAKTGFVFHNSTPVALEVEEPNDGLMELGETAFGSAIFVRFDSERTPIGPRGAPRALAALDLARDLWDVDAPILEAAPDLCR